MAVLNYAARQINCKIVYYGPGEGGKTTNLEYIYRSVDPETRGKMISLASETERTLLFDFLPVDLGEVRGFRTRFHLYSVPGQARYRIPRKLVLRGLDGVVFVADSDPEQMRENEHSMLNLRYSLGRYGIDLAALPFVIQYNKRDLPGAVAIDELQARLNPMDVPFVEAVSTRGEGVFETLRTVGKQVIRGLG